MLVWQENEEWWGTRYVTYYNGNTLEISVFSDEEDTQCYYWNGTGNRNIIKYPKSTDINLIKKELEKSASAIAA